MQGAGVVGGQLTRALKVDSFKNSRYAYSELRAGEANKVVHHTTHQSGAAPYACSYIRNLCDLELRSGEQLARRRDRRELRSQVVSKYSEKQFARLVRAFAVRRNRFGKCLIN